MDIAAFLYALSLCISLFALCLMIGVRVLRKQDIHSFLREQERQRFKNRLETKCAAEAGQSAPDSA